MKWFFSKQTCSEPKIKHIPKAFAIPKEKKNKISPPPKNGGGRGKTEVWFNAENVLYFKENPENLQDVFCHFKRMGEGSGRPF